MSVFHSVGDSSSSGDNSVPFLDAKEVEKRLNLDAKTVEWLMLEPPNEDEPILVLNFQSAFYNYGDFDKNKQAVTTALTDSGAVLVSDTVLKFESWTSLNAAKDTLWANMPWAFYHPHAATSQLLNISQQPTITTTAITLSPEVTNKLYLLPFQFFKL